MTHVSTMSSRNEELRACVELADLNVVDAHGAMNDGLVLVLVFLPDPPPRRAPRSALASLDGAPTPILSLYSALDSSMTAALS